MELSIRRLCAAAVVLWSVVVNPSIAANYDKLVHGPVTLANGNVVSFFQKDQQVWGQVFNTDAPDASGVLLDEYGSAEITAVFYFDFDKGGIEEVIVMLKDKSGQYLRAYAQENKQLIKLPRLQPVLDNIAPSLKPFSVDSVTAALNQVPPQKYSMTYDVKLITDPATKEIVDGTTQFQPSLIGYRNSEGSAADVNTAVEYKLRYPLTRKDTDIQGREHQYSLVTTFTRLGYGEKYDSATFILSEVAFEADDVDWPKTSYEDIPRSGPVYSYYMSGNKKNWLGIREIANYTKGVLHGPYGLYNGDDRSVIFGGDYKQGKKIGKWIEPENDERYWEGEYLNAKKQGKWLLRSMSDKTINLGFIHYNQDVLDGNCEIYTLDNDVKAKGTKRLSEKGIFRNGIKDGEWLEADDSKGRYEMGVKQGTWEEQITLGDYRFQLGKGNYIDGKRTGPWIYTTPFDTSNNDLANQVFIYPYKTVVSYVDGLRQGEAKKINVNNMVYAIQQYDKGLLHGQSISYSAPNIVNQIAQYRHGELEGRQIRFDPNGKLNELTHYKFNDALKRKPSQDECMLRQQPDEGDCEDVLRSRLKATKTSSIKDGKQIVYHDGQLSELSDYKNGSVEKEYQFANGQIMSLQSD